MWYAWLLYFVISSLLAMALGVWLERRWNRCQPVPAAAPTTPRRVSRPRETSEQFVARIIAEAEANDPADWWKRGEAPAEWSDDRSGENHDWSC
jgi:hypothetical protein